MLDIVRRSICVHITVLPEAAGIVFGGGFPRDQRVGSRRAAQRVIFFTEQELEAVADLDEPAAVLCDRGTVDGAAYWVGPGTLWDAMGTTRDLQLARYDTVIHLRTPPVAEGYDHANPLRRESAADAARIDERIAIAWAGHPHRFVVDATETFATKAARTLAILRAELPESCRRHLPRAVAQEGVASGSSPAAVTPRV